MKNKWEALISSKVYILFMLICVLINIIGMFNDGFRWSYFLPMIGCLVGAFAGINLYKQKVQ